MCGRFSQQPTAKVIAETFGLRASDIPSAPAKYNIAPGQSALAIALDKDTSRPAAKMLTWGLVPAWTKDLSKSAKPINARAETVAEKPSFREPLKIGRCVIPAAGFYEWKKGEHAPPYYIYPADGGIFPFAALCDEWHPSGEGYLPGLAPDCKTIRSFAIITVPANETVGMIHDRMPAILGNNDLKTWLSGKPLGKDELARLLRPAGAKSINMHEVSRAVNNTAIDSPELILPV